MPHHVLLFMNVFDVTCRLLEPSGSALAAAAKTPVGVTFFRALQARPPHEVMSLTRESFQGLRTGSKQAWHGHRVSAAVLLHASVESTSHGRHTEMDQPICPYPGAAEAHSMSRSATTAAKAA